MDLRIAVNQTMPGAGVNVRVAAQETLGNGGVYIARTRDFVYQLP